jgi:DNA-binding response OmpR family regulator
MRILVVDDNTAIVEALRDFLSDHFDVVAYDDSTTAQAALREHTFDVLITDYDMPGVTGTDLVAEAWSLDNRPYIIMATGSSDVGAIYSSPFIDKVFKKPYSFLNLLSHIKAAVRFPLT